MHAHLPLEQAQIPWPTAGASRAECCAVQPSPAAMPFLRFHSPLSYVLRCARRATASVAVSAAEAKQLEGTAASQGATCAPAVHATLRMRLPPVAGRRGTHKHLVLRRVYPLTRWGQLGCSTAPVPYCSPRTWQGTNRWREGNVRAGARSCFKVVRQCQAAGRHCMA